MKKINIALIVLLIISISFNAYQFNQVKSITDNLNNLETEKGLLEDSIAEKDLIIESNNATIEELTATTENMQAEIEELKEQLLVLKNEIEGLSAKKTKLKSKDTTTTTTQSNPQAGGGSANTSSEPVQTDPVAAFGAFGAQYGGSGREGGNNLGSGGAGIVMQ